MALTDARHYRLLAALVLFMIVGALGFLLREADTPWQDPLGQASYDSLHRITGQAWLDQSPVVVVYLDLASYQRQELDPLKPWPRALHAQLLRRLTADGAKAVIFDIVFSGPGPSPDGDASLASAIRESGRVILAAECNFDSSHVTSDSQVRALSHSIVPPADLFARSAASVGLAAQAIDDDYAVRRYVAGFSDSEPGLTWAAAKFLQLPAIHQPDALHFANASWLHYYGPPLSIPHVSYSEALDPAGVPAQFFRDKIVLIGARPWIEQFHERQDEFANPYHSWSKKLFMPGVEVHATEMLNLLRGDFVRRLSPRTEILLLLFCAAIFGGGLIWFRPVPATFAAATGIALVLALSCFAFNRGIRFPWLLVSAVQIPSAWAGSVLAHSLEWYRARKRFEQAKRIADAKIREQAALIDKAHDAILVQDLHGQTIYANPSAERLNGWTTHELQHNPSAAEPFSTDVDRARTARETVMNLGEWNGELRQQTRQGRTLVVASRWTRISDETGQPRALLIISTDVTSPAMHEVMALLRQAAKHPASTVLLTGETGVGKDLAAQVLHQLTFAGKTAPFVALNCGAIPSEMFESELFGAERGAYTGADKRRLGLVGAAASGTLFLDEIAEVPLPLQAKLLRLLEAREFRVLGNTENQTFTGRFVAATNRNLADEVKAGRFREDLLYRLDVFAIEIPPLRRRRPDIPALAESLLSQLARKYSRSKPLLRPEDLSALAGHDFPGNVRELRNVLERCLLRSDDDARWLPLDLTWLNHPVPSKTVSQPTPIAQEREGLNPIEAQEYRLIRQALTETNGGIRRAASKLGLSPQALLRRLEKWPELRPSKENS
jgi:PAS domain S-box-containing protein